MPGIKVKITDKGIGKTAAQVFGKAKASVTVGVFGEKGAEEHDGTSLTMAEIAELHEWGIGVPERSFIRSYIDAKDAEIMRAFLGQMKLAMRHAVQTGKPITDAQKMQILDRMGLKMVGDIQGRISNAEITQDLEDETIRRKGSSIALIDTGQLRSSISHLSEVKGK